MKAERMDLRRLNDEGMDRMAAFLRSLTTDDPLPYPERILTDERYSEALPVSIPVERRRFDRRFDLARYVYEKLAGSGLHAPERDKGLWAWLALYWFETLCARDRDGRLKPGELARWIPRLDEMRRYYRHLVLGPYLMYRAYADRPYLVEPLLCDAAHVPTGEAYRILIENPRLLLCPSVLGLIRQLYYDPGRRRLTKGAGRKGPGGLRRLAAFLAQLERTYDLPTLPMEWLADILPHEFAQYLPETIRAH